MSDKTIPDGPFEVELKIHFLNVKEGMDATVAYVLPRGKYPTREAVIGAIKEATKTVPPGYKILTRRQYFESIVGRGIHLPGGDAFPDAKEFNS